MLDSGYMVQISTLSLSLSSFHKLRARLKGEPPSLLLLLLPHPLSPSCLRYEPQEDEYEMSHNNNNNGMATCEEDPFMHAQGNNLEMNAFL